MIRKTPVVMTAVLALSAAFAIPLAASPRETREAGTASVDVPATPPWVEEMRKSCRYRSGEAGPGFCALAFGG